MIVAIEEELATDQLRNLPPDGPTRWEIGKRMRKFRKSYPRSHPHERHWSGQPQVPELAYSLVAIQRTIHKAALFSEGKPDKAVHLPTRRSGELALQVRTHEKGSDIRGLAPLLTDPAIDPVVQNLISVAVGAMAAYVRKRVLRRSRERAPADQKLVAAVFSDMRHPTDRIGNIGGVDRIVVIGHSVVEGRRVEMDATVRDYVRQIEHQTVPGQRTTVSGTVTQLLPQSHRIDNEDAPGHYVRVTRDEELFESVRCLPVLREREIRLEGVPFYGPDDSFGGPQKFRAGRLILPLRSAN